MIELQYDTKDDLPKGHEGLYTEKDGKFVLTGVSGMKTQADVDKVHDSLVKERGLKKAAESKLRAFDGIDSDGLQSSLDELEKLRLTSGKVDDKKIDEIVASRLELDKKAWERDSLKLTTELEQAHERNLNLVNEKNTQTIVNGLRDASKGKVNESALNDVLYRKGIFEVSEDGKILTKDGNGVTPGLEPEAWLDAELKTNTHWQKTVGGVGSKGSGSGSVGSKEGSSSIEDEVNEQVTFNE